MLVLAFSACSAPYVDDYRLKFSGTDLAGNSVVLDKPPLAGKVVLIDIWGLWCPPCLSAIPGLIDLKRRYGSQGFEVVGVEFASEFTGTREEYSAMLKSWAAEQGINYTIVQGGAVPDVSEMFPNLRSFSNFPTTILIGRDGIVRHVIAGVGADTDEWYAREIEKLLHERVPVVQK